MIHITERAANKVKEISDGEGLGHYIIRVKVVGGGCAGMTHDMTFDDQIGELDEKEEFDGITVVVDPLSFQYVDEVTIDYIDSQFGAGFKFLNPNVKGTCGCGSSFSV